MEMKPGIHSNYKCRKDNPSLLMKYDISIKIFVLLSCDNINSYHHIYIELHYIFHAYTSMTLNYKKYSDEYSENYFNRKYQNSSFSLSIYA